MARAHIDGQAENAQKAGATTVQAHGHDVIALPDVSFIKDADMARDGQDLVLQGPDGTVIVVEGYFSADPAPLLQAPHGETLTPALVNSFVHTAGPVQYAAADAMNDESPVGVVQDVTGGATITHPNGSTETVTIGTQIYEGDIIETSDNGAVNILFIDESTFAVSQNARLAIDEYVFDPDSNGGTSDFSVLRGLFVFTSGLIGRDDPDDVHIDTPMGSIGIRGTTIAGNADTGEITVLEGAIVLRGLDGSEVTLAQQFETARFNPEGGDVTYMGQTSPDNFNVAFEPIRSVSASVFTALDDAAAPAEAEESAEPQPSDATTDDTMQTAPDSSEPTFDGTDDSVFDQGATYDIMDPAIGETLLMDAAPQPEPTLTTTGTNSTPPDGTATTSDTALAAPLPPPPPSGTSASPPPNGFLLNTIGGANGYKIAGALGSVSHLGFSVSALGDRDHNGKDNFLVATDKVSGGTVLEFNGNTTTPVQTVAVGANTTDIPDVSGVGDFDADGTIDFIAGTPLADNIGLNAGGVTVQGASTFIVTGLNSGDQAGYSVAGIGDINGDGYNDVLAGAPGADNGGTNRGSALILYGNATGGALDATALSTNGVRIDNATDGQLMGISVGGAGDFDNDGFTDFMVANFTSGTTGQVRLFLGDPSSFMFDNTADAAWTFTGIGTDGTDDLPLTQMGDVNGDGISDIAIADTLNDRVHVLFGGGSVDTDLSNSVNSNGFTMMNSGSGTFDGGGYAGDFNGDGFDDAAIAVRNGTIADIFVVYGKAGLAGTIDVQTMFNDTSKALHMVYNIGNTNPFDFNIGTAGDVNGDGFDDLLIGTPDANSSDGGFTVVYGRNTSGTGSDGIILHKAFDWDSNGVPEAIASANGAHLVGTVQADLLTNRNGATNYAAVDFRGGAGDDLIVLHGSNFGTIEGGTGYDRMDFFGISAMLDFSVLGSEKLSGIEKISLMDNGQTLKLGLDDIFRLLQESQDGTLKIADMSNGNGSGTTTLTIENNFAGGSTLSSLGFVPNGAVVDGGTTYNAFDFGSGYTLLIDQNVNTVNVV